jgi:disulfide bond formation protein DsbB
VERQNLKWVVVAVFVLAAGIGTYIAVQTWFDLMKPSFDRSTLVQIMATKLGRFRAIDSPLDEMMVISYAYDE